MKKTPAWLLAILCLCALPTLAVDDDHWDTRFGVPGADGAVNAMVASGSDLFVTGSFTAAGQAACIGVAKWNGTKWTGFGSGFSWGSTPMGMAIAVRGDELFVGGIYITNISGVPVHSLARWDGSRWLEVGGGVNGYVYSLLCKGNDLYVAGMFTTAGSITASNIARWDGTNWFPLGSGLYDATNSMLVAKTLALDAHGDLIVGGNFRYAGGVEVNNLARWDGTQWHAMGSGLFSGGSGQMVNALLVRETNVYVAGVFKSAGGVNATNLARWDGLQWNAMGGGPYGTNTSLALLGTNLYTAGNFTNIQGVAARHVARWNGLAWEALTSGTAGEILTKVTCLASDGVNLYAGGDFVQAGTAGALAISKWDGSQWSALAGSQDQGVWLAAKVLSASDNDLYIGGSGVLSAGGLKPNRIAHWDGSDWDNVGGGVSGGSADVTALLQYGSTVYVGGNFTNAGGVAARNIAYWDGANWHPMGSGLNNNVYALCVHQGQLFAGGSFTARGDGAVTLPGIARWSGSDWETVPVISSWRINNVVNCLLSDGSNLYIGGNYFVGWFEPYPPYNGADVENIGYWDGNNWWPLGMGLSNTVNSLAVVGSDLYACGSFTNSGSTTTRRLAKWNGSAWSEVGGGITNGTVSTLAAKGSTLYVGGSFTNLAGVASRLATWDGIQWRALASGVLRISTPNYSVARIAVSGEDVYLIGSFTHAGGRPSAGLAHWNETISFIPPTVRLFNLGMDSSRQFHFDLSGLTTGTFTVQTTTNLIDWTDLRSDTVPNTNFNDFSSGLPLRFYRVKTP